MKEQWLKDTYEGMRKQSEKYNFPTKPNKKKKKKKEQK